MQRERGRRSRRMIVSFNRKDRQQRRLSRAESWRHVQAGGSLSFLGAEVITRIALPGENFFLAESRAYTTPTLYFSPPHPLATLLSSRTAHARRELFACMDRARHVNREHRRHFSFFSLSLPSFPATQSFTGRGTPLFSTFSRRIRAARIKRLAYFRLIGRATSVRLGRKYSFISRSSIPRGFTASRVSVTRTFLRRWSKILARFIY